jgi:hypothetical protein
MQDAIPAAASIVAGRYSDQNPYVKALAGFVGGAGGAMLSGPGSAESILRSKLPASVTEQHINRAGQLIDHAQSTRRFPYMAGSFDAGYWPFRTDGYAANPRKPRTDPSAYGRFLCYAADGVENMARSEFDWMGTQHPNPSSIGAEASDVAGETLNNVRGQINRAAEPFYQASEGILLTPAEMSHVRAIPGWTEARDAVRNNEQLNWRVAHLPTIASGFSMR